MGIREDHSQVIEADPADLDLAHEHIIAGNRFSGHGLKIRFLERIYETAPDELAAKRLVADADLRAGVDHNR